MRLVGRQVPGCLTVKETCYRDGTEAAILDVFEADLGDECGSNSHPEDVSIKEECWRPVRRYDQPSDLRTLGDYVNKNPAVLMGYGDRIYARKFENGRADRSLDLVRPDDLWWWIREENGKRRNRAVFRVGNVSRARYDLAVTDPVWLDRLKPLAAGIYPHSYFFTDAAPKTLLTVSLSEPFEGFHYKLVAGVIAFSG